jgi:hypothetical protein
MLIVSSDIPVSFQTNFNIFAAAVLIFVHNLQ